ncbi:MAG: ABC transporter ATP-binding protein [SAR202 cluster bacterium]|nr:ABC transporter ATP-binding protein [SAR202 cluster bacterium]
MSIFLRIMRHAAAYKYRLLLAYCSSIGVAAFALVIPRIIGEAVDKVISSGDLRPLVMLALAALAVSVGRGICAYGQQYLGESLGQRVAYDIRNLYFDKMQSLSFAFHDSQKSGDLMSRATADVEGIRMFIQGGAIRGAFMILLIFGVSVILILTSWKLAILSLVFMPLIILRTSTIMMAMRRNWLAEREEMGKLNTLLQENLSGQRVVKAFAAEEHEKEKFVHGASLVAHYGFTAEKLQAITTSLNNFFFLGGTGVILWFGGKEVIDGQLTEGQLVSFLLYMGLLSMPVRMFAFIVNSFARALSTGERIFFLLDAESPVQESALATTMPKANGSVAFKNVSFRYEESDNNAITNIDIEAPSSQIVAILGAPGSGKSTLVHLIPRFYDVSSGSITIDGQDIRDVTLKSLRQNVGIVQQDIFIFTSTIRANIAYGAIHASDAEVKRVAELAQMHDFIMGLPEGYDTYVGERGSTLSGGQRQRLAIARTLLMDPPVLILDDSTSSVDTETEHLIQKALENVMEGRTTFVIAHRLSSVQKADKLLVLDKGYIVQQGTHAELLGVPGPYREIYELQLRPQETNGVVSNRNLGNASTLHSDSSPQTSLQNG